MTRYPKWNIAPAAEAANELATQLRVAPLIAQMLFNRGARGPADAESFLTPNLNHLHDPKLLPGLLQASQRIVQAIRDKQKIVIYGDYDVDGITATSILWHAIRLLGGVVDYYIPHRMEEGYGLNAEAMHSICDAGAGLIISVDCGITAIDEAKVCKDRGVHLIITDHHEWKEGSELGVQGSADSSALNPEPRTLKPCFPDCHTLVHPRLPADPPYPNPNLCGAGVAFKLAWGIGLAWTGSSRVSDDYKWFLVEATALAALGTIADVVPLTGENRILAHFGLTCLQRSKLRGIRALIDSAGLTGKNLDAYDVGFMLAPRLNASGRMGHARLAVEMLTVADAPRAKEIATYLEEQNRSRQAEERRILDQALKQVEELGFAGEKYRGVVLGAEGWHSGVIGIVASRVVSRLNKPVVMVALSNGHGQGSARSIPGFHLARALSACCHTLEGCGGHEMAAGLRLKTSQFEDFRRAFCEYAAQHVSDEMLQPQLRLDAIAEFRQLNLPVVSDMHRLGPFGTANPRPVICCKNVEVTAQPRLVGKNAAHIQVYLRQGNVTFQCVAFNRAELAPHLRPGTRLDLAVEPSVNEYNGHRTVQLELRDLKLLGTP